MAAAASSAHGQQEFEIDSMPVLFQSAVDAHTRLVSMSAMSEEYKVSCLFLLLLFQHASIPHAVAYHHCSTLSHCGDGGGILGAA